MPEPGSFKAAFAGKGFAFDSGVGAWQGSRRLRIGRTPALANPELGAKQICPNCSSKFYDLNRRPAVCPKCGESFDPEEAVKNRRVRSRVATPDYEDAEDTEEKVAKPEAEDGFEEEADDTPEIDEAAEADVIETDDDDTDAEPGAPAAPADDLGVDFAEDEDIESGDDDDSVPFLEDEDEDDFPEDEIDVSPDGDDDV
jgi:uncharacterized protein (TIGR02300 family)